MNASDTTPPSGESVTDASVDFEQLGQRLLSQECERIGQQVFDEFKQASVKAERGDLDREDWNSLSSSVRQAEILVDVIHEAIEESQSDESGGDQEA